MPEFILPAEADRCPHCGQVLHNPPNCCQAMREEHAAALPEAVNEDADWPHYPDYGEDGDDDSTGEDEDE